MILTAVAPAATCGAEPEAAPNRGAVDLASGGFQWRVSRPLVETLQRPGDVLYSIKDPSVVCYEGRWHLFCTVRGRDRSHQVEYLTFRDWEEVGEAKRQLLAMHPGFFCAPQVFYFRPHEKWYLICQASDELWEPEYGAAYATASDIADPASWSPLAPLGHRKADGKSGLDFWVICDDTKAHLFFTTLDGRMWREETPLDRFPLGWSEPQLAIRGDVFEASHTYKLKGQDKYLTLIEAQGGHGWRYYKAYLADRLDGEWEPLAATKDHCFASMANTRPSGPRWTDSISHGELLRAGYDQRLEVDPADLRFLFQGVTNQARSGKKYGEIPWRLGLLEPEHDVPPGPNRPDEPFREEFSMEAAVRFLDTAALTWQNERKCFACHSDYALLFTRPLVSWKVPAHEQLRAKLEHLAENPRDVKYWVTETVMVASVLAQNDALTTGKLHPTTRKALDRMWTAQRDDGGFTWMVANEPPSEIDDHYGVTMAAIGVGMAPEDYAQTPAAQAGLERIRHYFQNNPPENVHHRAMKLLTSLHVDGVMTAEERQELIRDLSALQKPDGGWGLATLGNWHRDDGTPQDMDTSDGYGTGFAVYVLRQAGVPADDPRIRKGINWLKTHQRASGRWFTRSMRRDSKHYITHSGTAYAILALALCGEAAKVGEKR